MFHACTPTQSPTPLKWARTPPPHIHKHTQEEKAYSDSFCKRKRGREGKLLKALLIMYPYLRACFAWSDGKNKVWESKQGHQHQVSFPEGSWEYFSPHLAVHEKNHKLPDVTEGMHPARTHHRDMHLHTHTKKKGKSDRETGLSLTQSKCVWHRFTVFLTKVSGRSLSRESSSH